MVTGLLLLVGVFILVLGIRSTGKPTPIVDDQGRQVEGSISEIEEIELGGVKQWIITRAIDTSNPLLLFVHGGPGSTEFPFYKQYATQLERDFIVVHWEQRGAGKSFSSELTADQLSVDHFVSDIDELSRLLKSRHQKEKIYILGHSWGTTIATLAAYRYPEHFHAYIGMGQEIQLKAAVLVSNEMLKDCAEKHGYDEILTGLKQLPPQPPYAYDIEIERNSWIVKCRGDIYCEGTNMFKELYSAFMTLNEYTLTDKLNWFRSIELGVNLIIPTYVDLDLSNEAVEFEVPVYFIQGIHDMQTPASLVEEYFEKLTAPDKEMFMFYKSAHAPLFEETEKTLGVIRSILQKTKEGSI